MNPNHVAQVEGLIRNIVWQQIKAALPSADKPPLFEVYVKKRRTLGESAKNFFADHVSFSWDFRLGECLGEALGANHYDGCTVSGRFSPYSHERRPAKAIILEMMERKVGQHASGKGDDEVLDGVKAQLQPGPRLALLNRPDVAFENIRHELEAVYVQRILEALALAP
jgi:hypothetical protein